MITWLSKSRRQLPTQRSATPFCHGLRKAVRVGWLPISLTAETTSAPNFASRSNSKNLCGCLWAHASRNCCTTQSALGFRVTLKCRILRRSWPLDAVREHCVRAEQSTPFETESCSRRLLLERPSDLADVASRIWIGQHAHNSDDEFFANVKRICQ